MASTAPGGHPCWGDGSFNLKEAADFGMLDWVEDMSTMYKTEITCKSTD